MAERGRPESVAHTRLKSGHVQGKQIRTLIEELGWTQKLFSEHLDVRESTISEWVNDRPPAPKIVLLYLKLLVRFNNAERERRHGQVSGR